MNSGHTLTTRSRRSTTPSPLAAQSTAENGSSDAASRGQADARARQEMIAVQAYYLAEARAFAPGAELDDWLAAEALLDARLREAQPDGAATESSP
jgi:Protein of unknown function (DUF2934)